MTSLVNLNDPSCISLRYIYTAASIPYRSVDLWKQLSNRIGRRPLMEATACAVCTMRVR
jgi:hypothetical protein